MSMDTWIRRLTARGRETFVCAYRSDIEAISGTSSSRGYEGYDASTIEAVLQSEWIASTTLIGPSPLSSFALPPLANERPYLPDEEEEKWHMTALYVDPAHRGHGVAFQLCGFAFQSICIAKRSPRYVRVRIAYGPGNKIVRALYERLGFEAAGMFTLREGMIANGDGDLVPLDADPSIFDQRGGFAMIRLYDRGV